MKQSTRTLLVAIIVPLFALQMFLQSRIDPSVAEIHRGEKNTLAGLSNEFILGPMLGLQQAVAGALWVRADEFFHEGDYDAILPMVRMVTWLDPHQLDVYITGAWHLSYNFTDSSERSDRRYIPAAQRLLQEGDENNPTVYDIAFEMGWENIDKIKNYDRAEQWFRTASTRSAVDESGHKSPPPMFVWHQLAHALERQGRVDECIGVWRKALAMSEDKLKKNPNPQDFMSRNVRDTEFHNLNLTLERKFSRYTHRIDFDLDRKFTKSVDQVTGEPSPNSCYLSIDPKEGPIGQPRPAATAKPWDVAFDGHVTVPSPKVLQFDGQFNVGDGARVTIQLADENYREVQLKDFTFQVDPTQTIMVDQHSVRGGKWGRKVDMSKDPKMYSFTAPAYYIVLSFDPRGTSPFIQDRFGWSGEGLADKTYLWTVKSRFPNVPDDRIIRKVLRVTKRQLMGYEPITDKDVVPNAEYDRLQKQAAPAQ